MCCSSTTSTGTTSGWKRCSKRGACGIDPHHVYRQAPREATDCRASQSICYNRASMNGRYWVNPRLGRLTAPGRACVRPGPVVPEGMGLLPSRTAAARSCCTWLDAGIKLSLALLVCFHLISYISI
jgi:hypothetical protein